MSGIFLIQPVAIPQSAAINFAGGDVKHVSSIADALEGDNLAAPSRMLAYRDVVLAEKVNELVAAINNKDQFINLPLPATTLPGGATQVVTNYRIPPGFEARVLNAKVASTPTRSIQLNVGYNDGIYGFTSFQTTPVSTFDEFIAGSLFYGTGEFVVQLINASGRTATATASIMLTMRPVAAQKGGIIGPGAVGAKGEKGDKGNQGDQGNPGLPGNPGSIGFSWRGSWSSVTSYSARDAVEYGMSSWFATAPNTNDRPPETSAGSSLIWDLVAGSGTQGYQGAQGVQGAGFQGAQGPEGESGLSGFQGAPGTPGLSVGPMFEGKRASTAIITSTTDFVAAASSTGVYSTVVAGSNNQSFPFYEVTAWNGEPDSPNLGISVLRGQRYAVFTGSVFVQLPRTTDGMILNWYGTDISVSVAQHGTVYSPSDAAPTVQVDGYGNDTFSITSNAAVPAKVHIAVFGTKVWPL